MVSFEEKIANYYKEKPKFTDLWQQHPPTDSKKNSTQVPSTTTNMPVHPSEETATGSMLYRCSPPRPHTNTSPLRHHRPGRQGVQGLYRFLPRHAPGRHWSFQRWNQSYCPRPQCRSSMSLSPSIQRLTNNRTRAQSWPRDSESQPARTISRSVPQSLTNRVLRRYIRIM